MVQYKERRAGKKKMKRMQIAVKPAHFTCPASLMPAEWIQACIHCGNDAPVLLGGQAEVRYRFNLYMERWRAALLASPAALEDLTHEIMFTHDPVLGAISGVTVESLPTSPAMGARR